MNGSESNETFACNHRFQSDRLSRRHKRKKRNDRKSKNTERLEKFILDLFRQKTSNEDGFLVIVPFSLLLKQRLIIDDSIAFGVVPIESFWLGFLFSKYT